MIRQVCLQHAPLEQEHDQQQQHSQAGDNQLLGADGYPSSSHHPSTFASPQRSVFGPQATVDSGMVRSHERRSSIVVDIALPPELSIGGEDEHNTGLSNPAASRSGSRTPSPTPGTRQGGSPGPRRGGAGGGRRASTTLSLYQAWHLSTQPAYFARMKSATQHHTHSNGGGGGGGGPNNAAASSAEHISRFMSPKASASSSSSSTPSALVFSNQASSAYVGVRNAQNIPRSHGVTPAPLHAPPLQISVSSYSSSPTPSSSLSSSPSRQEPLAISYVDGAYGAVLKELGSRRSRTPSRLSHARTPSHSRPSSRCYTPSSVAVTPITPLSAQSSSTVTPTSSNSTSIMTAVTPLPPFRFDTDDAREQCFKKQAYLLASPISPSPTAPTAPTARAPTWENALQSRLQPVTSSQSQIQMQTSSHSLRPGKSPIPATSTLAGAASPTPTAAASAATASAAACTCAPYVRESAWACECILLTGASAACESSIRGEACESRVRTEGQPTSGREGTARASSSSSLSSSSTWTCKLHGPYVRYVPSRHQHTRPVARQGSIGSGDNFTTRTRVSLINGRGGCDSGDSHGHSHDGGDVDTNVLVSPNYGPDYMHQYQQMQNPYQLVRQQYQPQQQYQTRAHLPLDYHEHRLQQLQARLEQEAMKETIRQEEERGESGSDRLRRLLARNPLLHSMLTPQSAHEQVGHG